jgi:hypothetical protein
MENPLTDREVIDAIASGVTDDELRILTSVLTKTAGRKHLGRNVADIIADRNVVDIGLARFVKCDFVKLTTSHKRWKRAVERFPAGTIRLDVKTLDAFIGILRVNSCVSRQALDLGFNKIGAAGVAALAEAFGREGDVPSPQTLSLCDNNVGPAGAAALAKVLGREGAVPSLHTLYLICNEMGDAGAATFAEALVVKVPSRRCIRSTSDTA